MVKMTTKEIRRFLKKGTFTAKLATVKKDGKAHVVPVWFVLSDQNSGKFDDIYLTTGIESVKANNI
jgi:nitroimidazol reductase NimA-like FMN-containing flavoprotein (pyridoxamine 5'-phosphate oxidase superfamily)